MKAISLWQPWASLMAAGAKHNETRSWRTCHFGDLVVCSAKKRLGYLPVELHGTVFEAFRYGEESYFAVFLDGSPEAARVSRPVETSMVR